MDQGRKKIKPDPQMLKDLWSADDLTVLKTIQRLRSDGNLTYMPDLLNLLERTSSEIIEKELIRFLADIKQKAVVPLVVEGLRETGLERARAGILSAIWQSGLDYSAYLDLFIQLFLEGDYMVALESFTVIEQSVEHLSDEMIAEERKNLLDGLKNVSEDKKPLARELVNILQT
jgi:hypothetical protein